MRYFPALLILAFVISAAAQSARVIPTPTPTAGPTVKQMFDEANTYLQAKRQSYLDQKIKLTDALYAQAVVEQRQLAAKNAAIAATRTSLAGEDLYHLGMLNWIAENYDGTYEWLRKFAAANPDTEKAQLARTFTVLAAVKLRKLPDAEAALADYNGHTPIKPKQQWQMDGALARAYEADKDFTRMAAHAAQFLLTSKALVKGVPLSLETVNTVLDAGLLVFRARAGAGDQPKADAALDDMRRDAIEMASSTFYFYAVDQKITYLIETGRKPAAMDVYLTSLIEAGKVLPTTTGQEDAAERLRRREPQYKLLGTQAPEFTAYDKWFPGEPRKFTDMRGKVVLLDFWATWCGPCFEAFPAIREWQQDFGPDGFEVLGVTRYYGGEVGFAKNPDGELEYMKNFRKNNGLKYDFVVASDQLLQLQYSATALPTTVLVDRRGIIRYIESGTSPTRLEEMRGVITRLLAEK